ncbi:MAG TPA: phosphatase PAP2 family protein [Cyclobacteriaceae bacterium]
MKTIKYYGMILVSTCLLTFVVASCNKDIENLEKLTPLLPTELDEDAETWLSVNNDPTDVTLAKIRTAAETAPKIFDPGVDNGAVQNVGSATYLAELQAIKDLQKNLTGEQKEIIEYWSCGGVLRWNQILRGLVARYNLPPAPLGDGTYPVPDAENPFGDPNFPFANPPYASRSYAYVSVAQYEALKAAWFYMYEYNRPSPYITDSGIQSLMPETGLPAYPSHDAVLSGVTAEMLKLLFPAALEEITRHAANQRNAALWSGRATSSDIAKGLALGKSVASLVTNRARNDRMGTAGGNKALWQALADTATKHGEIPWISLETPKRPPMLPFFGLRKTGVSVGVKTWIMTDNDIRNNRPVPPPPTASTEMKDEVAEVKWYSENLTRERMAIVHKWADGVNTHTPAGHWNDIMTEYVRDASWSEVRAARAYALLNITMHEAAVACWDTKFFYFNPRPSQMNADIKTGTGVPNFPAFTSGHSTFSGSASVILSYLFPADADYFESEAREASMSRLYGGIHYRSDVEMGYDHGQVVGGFVVNFATNDGAD